jgi:8-oxo-dGTP pyrophosphatase MutT (NUDIX family)
MKNILYIFDFDDTLVKSDAEVTVTHRDGSITRLSSEEFAKYNPHTGDDFDFSEFEKYPQNARPINPVLDRLNRAIAEQGNGNVIVLTARQHVAPVKEFLSDQGVDISIQIVAVGSADPNDKARFVLSKLKNADYDGVHVFEDNINNINAIKNVVKTSGIGFKHTLIDESCHSYKDRRLLKELVGFRDAKIATWEKKKKSPGAGIITLKRSGGGWKVLGLRIPGAYDLPKGTIEHGESTIATALRETEEEAGIHNLSFPWGMLTIPVGNITFYIAEAVDEPVIRPNPETGEYEHYGYKWLGWEEAINSVKPYMSSAIRKAKFIVTGE